VTVVVYNQISLMSMDKRGEDSGHTGVGVLLGSDVVQLNDVAALVAALNGALAGDLVHPISVLRFSI
jgi:hypothetical protein